MKYIKKYNEDIDWDWVDEEIEENNFKVGDIVCLNTNGIYLRSQYSYPQKNSKSYIIKNNNDFIKEKNVIEKILYIDDNEMIFKLERKWPWYLAKFWKKYDI